MQRERLGPAWRALKRLALSRHHTTARVCNSASPGFVAEFQQIDFGSLAFRQLGPAVSSDGSVGNFFQRRQAEWERLLRTSEESVYEKNVDEVFELRAVRAEAIKESYSDTGNLLSLC